MRNGALLDIVKDRTFDALLQVCGGENTAEGRAEWIVSLKQTVERTVSWTANKRAWGEPEGKPWDIEVRTASSLYSRFRDRLDGSWTITSSFGLPRTICSSSQLAQLLVPNIEIDFRCDVNHDSGHICIVSPERSANLRDAGKLPCPFCVHWYRGEKGLWWHVQGKHRKGYEHATEAATASQSMNSIIVFDPTMSTAAKPNDNVVKKERKAFVLPAVSPFEAAREGNLVLLRKLIKEGFCVMDLDQRGANVLHWAAGGGHLIIVQYLLNECSMPVDTPQKAKRSFGGRTALHWASRMGHLKVVHCLVDDFGANLEAQTTDGTTAFCWAAWQGHSAVLKFLCTKGANINSVNSFGCNPCLWAAQGSATETILNWMENAGCDIYNINANGHSILHKAAQRGNPQICDWFHRRINDDRELSDYKRIQLYGPDSDNCVASDLAGMEGHTELAIILAQMEMRVARASSLKRSQLPAWISENPRVTTTDLVWEPGAGLNRMATSFQEQQTISQN